MASNGINDLGKFDFVSDGMYPGSQIDHSYYADATQVPLGAQAVQADYDPQTNPLTGEPVSRFSKGGIAAIPKMKNRGIAALHFDGTEGSQVEEPAAWNPESGQVILQQHLHLIQHLVLEVFGQYQTQFNKLDIDHKK